MPIQVEIVTRDRALFGGEADMVLLPGVEGQMGVMEGHAPLLSTLDIGEIVLQTGDQTEYIAVSGGVVEVRPDKVTVLAEAAEHADEIDIERAEQARERARQLLGRQPAAGASHRDGGSAAQEHMAYPGAPTASDRRGVLLVWADHRTTTRSSGVMASTIAKRLHRVGQMLRIGARHRAPDLFCRRSVGAHCVSLDGKTAISSTYVFT